MLSTIAPEPASILMASRLKDATSSIARQWSARIDDLTRTSADLFPARYPGDHIPDLIAAVAHDLATPGHTAAMGDGPPSRSASASRFGAASSARNISGRWDLHVPRRAGLYRVLRGYEILGELLEDFLVAAIAEAEPPMLAVDAMRILRRVAQSVRIRELETIDAFVAEYIDQIDRQRTQLQSFSQVVAVEIRQPLSVLQVMSRLLPVPMGDMEAVRFADVFDRNVRRLVEVAARLERLANNEERRTKN